MTTVTVVYEMRDEEDAQQLLELFKTRKVMEGTGSIVACCQGDAMQERDKAKLWEEALKKASDNEDIFKTPAQVLAYIRMEYKSLFMEQADS